MQRGSPFYTAKANWAVGRLLSISLVLAAVAIAQAPGLPDQVLRPLYVFGLRSVLGLDSRDGFQVLEMSANSGQLWFLYRKADESHFLTATTPDGKRSALVALGQRAAGLAATDAGIFVQVVDKEKGKQIRQYTSRGEPRMQYPVPCIAPGKLVSREGSITSICPDGAMITYDALGHESRNNSWARLGTLALAFEPLFCERPKSGAPSTTFLGRLPDRIAPQLQPTARPAEPLCR